MKPGDLISINNALSRFMSPVNGLPMYGIPVPKNAIFLLLDYKKTKVMFRLSLLWKEKIWFVSAELEDFTTIKKTSLDIPFSPL